MDLESNTHGRPFTTNTNSHTNNANTKPGAADKSSENNDVVSTTSAPEPETGQILTRKFTPISLLSLSLCVLGTYSTFAQDLSSGLTNGGPITILWGMVLVTVCNIAVAVSMGELVSAMPTALGQAFWVYHLWRGQGRGARETGRFVSYACAWVNVFGWWCLGASMVAFMVDFTLGIRELFGFEGDSPGWLKFVLYVAFTFILTLINVVGCRRDAVLPWLNNFVGVCFLGLFVILSLAMLIGVGATDGLSFQPASFVFGRWLNTMGWSDGVVWFTGLVQAAYGLTAFDSVIHLVEEIPSPRRNAPRIIWMAVTSGAITGFIFMVVCLFCVQDLDTVVNASLPFLTLMDETTPRDAATTLLVLFIFNGLGQGVGILTTASRLTWGFARDGGLPFHRYLSRIDNTWKAPVRALWAQGILTALIGILYLFSSAVLQAILSVSTIALTISYGIPIGVLLFVAGRENLPAGGCFKLGRWGGVCNVVSLVYCAVTTVFFFFPESPRVQPGDMNWAIAVFAVMLVVAGIFWCVQGRWSYLSEGAIASAYLVEVEGEMQPEKE